MLDLESAIKHCEEVAEYKEAVCKTMENEEGEFTDSGNTYYKYCKRRASEHRQLAEWLRELQAYEDAREEIARKRDSVQWSEAVVFGLNHAIYIIDKHLTEVNADG